jgi:hypothetical protein
MTLYPHLYHVQNKLQQGVVTHHYNLSTLETEAGRFGVASQRGLLGEFDAQMVELLCGYCKALSSNLSAAKSQTQTNRDQNPNPNQRNKNKNKKLNLQMGYIKKHGKFFYNFRRRKEMLLDCDSIQFSKSW